MKVLPSLHRLVDPQRQDPLVFHPLGAREKARVMEKARVIPMAMEKAMAKDLASEHQK